MSDTLVLNKHGLPLSVIPLSVVSWQTAIRLYYSEKVNILKEYDTWTVRSPSVTMKVPSIIITTDFINWNRHVKYNRTNVFLRDDFTCQYCLEKNSASNLTLDHVLPRNHGGKTNWVNITTACKECNSEKGNNKKITPAKAPYKPSYYELMNKRQKYPLKIKDEAWADFLSWPKELVVLDKHKHNQ